jgi:hypothetical protein
MTPLTKTQKLPWGFSPTSFAQQLSKRFANEEKDKTAYNSIAS